MPRINLALIALTALVLLAGCGDDFGEPCSLPTGAAVESFCGSVAGDGGDDRAQSSTCVFTNSAQCSSRVCARYIGSRDFCSAECDPAVADSCPGNALCQALPASGTAFCVPDAILESVE